ncbi:MAG: hypothetical protein LQ346_001669 [Caloplaca aetnensis]|nr:MAG: hypothetical protein LQ346_001669 [Caloplaca aetnensis]
MWLLDTSTLKLCEHYPQEQGEASVSGSGWVDPPYAILSHTWGDEEVSFQEIANPAAKRLHGYRKIEQCCALARSQGHGLLWIDTCCINRSSSAELSEAINSMYNWYRKSTVGYVYLSDFSFPPDEYGDRGIRSNPFVEQFGQSRWWRRGWTLQELLAPYNLEFYDQHWRYIGDKADLVTQISASTGINQQYVLEWGTVTKASVAARMSWAARRSTTRPEDEAYCLMGLFGVNMPLLYGEGHKAFLRLQHEIAKDSDDDTLFAWHVKTVSVKWVVSGMFAARPTFFAGCEDLVALPDLGDYRAPYTLTNKGLAVDAYYKPLPFEELAHQFNSLGGPSVAESAQSTSYCLLPLKCARDRDLENPFTLILKRKSPATFVRIFPWEKEAFRKYFKQAGSGQHQTMYIQTPAEFSIVSRHGRDLFLEIPPSAIIAPGLMPRHEGVARAREYALKEWYVTTRGRVTPSHYRWKVYLPAVPGFAVMTFKRYMGGSFTIFLDFAPDEEEPGMHVVLDISADTGSFAEIVNAYQATFNANMETDAFSSADRIQKAIPKNCKEQMVRASDGTAIRLVRLEQQLPQHDGNHNLARFSLDIFHPG